MSALALASVSFGTSSIFIRFATAVSALSLTFFRLSIAATVMVMLACSTHTLKRLERIDLLLIITSGVMLSLHFATFILAVKFTTVANATFLVDTSPVMLAVLSPLLIRERTTSRESFGVLIATFGILLVANAGNGFRSFGLADVSALLAALFVSIYSLIGRYLRTHGVDTVCYTAYVYSTATFAALMLTESLGSNPFVMYSDTNLLAILGLALVPTIMGHSLYNYSLGSVKAVTANLFPLLEPILSSTFAVWLFGEVPSYIQIAGYALIILAVVTVITGSIEEISVSDKRSILKYNLTAQIHHVLRCMRLS